MGFYLRKSMKLGPFRLNLSKSGIGVSAGVKGFRVSTGPRGAMVHMGRHGLYYRKTLGRGARRPREQRNTGLSALSANQVNARTEYDLSQMLW